MGPGGGCHIFSYIMWCIHVFGKLIYCVKFIKTKLFTNRLKVEKKAGTKRGQRHGSLFFHTWPGRVLAYYHACLVLSCFFFQVWIFESSSLTWCCGVLLIYICLHLYIYIYIFFHIYIFTYMIFIYLSLYIYIYIFFLSIYFTFLQKSAQNPRCRTPARGLLHHLGCRKPGSNQWDKLGNPKIWPWKSQKTWALNRRKILLGFMHTFFGGKGSICWIFPQKNARALTKRLTNHPSKEQIRLLSLRSRYLSVGCKLWILSHEPWLKDGDAGFNPWSVSETVVSTRWAQKPVVSRVK